MESDVLEDHLESFLERELELKISTVDWMMKKTAKLMEDFEAWVEKKFKKIPYVSKWSTDAKVLLFAMTVVPPTIFTVIWIVFFLHAAYLNHQVSLKY